MRRSPLIFALISLLASGLLAWFVSFEIVETIEANTRENAVTTLAAAGQNWASAEPDGMLLVLSGEAPDDAAKFSSLEVLGKVVNGNRIVDLSTVPSAVARVENEFHVEILRAEVQTRLTGLRPIAASEQPLTERIAKITGGAVDATLLDEIADVPPANWVESLEFALVLLPEINSGNIIVLPGKVDVDALAPSDASRTILENKLESLQPEGIALSLSIHSPLPIVAPYRFALTLDAGVVNFTECVAETGEGRARILSAVRRAGATEFPHCNLGLGAPSTTWPQAVDLAVAGLEELGAGTLSITDTAVTLTALAGADAAKLEQIRADLALALPPIYSITAVLPTTAVESEAAFRPLFTANLRDEGYVTLNGVMPDEASRSAVATFATSLFRFGHVQSNLKVDARSPEGWSTRVLAGVETLALLHSGTLTVSLEKVYLEGRAVSPDIDAEVKDALRARLQEGQEFTTLVVTDPSLEKELTPPANTECVAEVTDILASNQITFAPNSGKIAEESLPVIDDIALVLKNCATAAFEIGGHTDSQGGEVLNQALSQTRADAVLDALLERDVLVAHMSARGYGDSQPIGDNDTEEGRAKNRRIAFKLLENFDEQN